MSIMSIKNINNTKKKYGQFYTTNVDYILNTCAVPKNITIVEPFAGTERSGSGDIIRWVEKQTTAKIEAYDIDVKDIISKDTTTQHIQQDTLKNPLMYDGKFIITNPPMMFNLIILDKLLLITY